MHGCFSRVREAVLSISSGDTIVARTLDAGWGLDPFAEDILAKRIPLEQRLDPENDRGHCLIGPIEVRDTRPGQTLEIEILDIVPSAVGATWVGEVKEFLKRLGVDGHQFLPWTI